MKRDSPRGLVLSGLALPAVLLLARGVTVVWVLEPVTVRVGGLLALVHDFQSASDHLARLSGPPWPGPATLELADGSQLQVVPLGTWRRKWLLWHGESELAQGQAAWPSRRAEMVYQAVPYFVLPAGRWGYRYRLVNEADSQVLTIAFRGPLRREAVLSPQIALDLALVVFAYDLARRLI